MPHGSEIREVFSVLPNAGYFAKHPLSRFLAVGVCYVLEGHADDLGLRTSELLSPDCQESILLGGHVDLLSNHFGSGHSNVLVMMYMMRHRHSVMVSKS